jgi:membrane-associated phospholipid phosphatase
VDWRSPLIFAWGIVGIFLTVDLILLPVSKLTIAPSINWNLLKTALIFGGAYGVSRGICYRLQSDVTKTARFIVAVAKGLERMVYAGLFIAAIGLVGTTFSYLSTSLSWPLRDGDLAIIDRAIGFDWPAFLAWTNNHPLIAVILKTAYRTAGPQLMLAFVYLSFSRSGKSLDEFIAIFAITSLLTGIGMTLIPAEGAYAYYHPTDDQFSVYGLNAGTWHHETLVALRTDAAFVLDFSDAQGLVTFPSFHTALAVITSYVMRVSRIFAAPIAALNCIVIVGTITEGGHHLTDVIAGGLIAIFAILFVRRLNLSRRLAPGARIAARTHKL